MHTSKNYAIWLMGAAAIVTAVFCAFGIHVAAGGAYEARTAWAMTLRSAVWIVIAALIFRAIKRDDSTPAALGGRH
jgi:hypothetical protein